TVNATQQFSAMGTWTDGSEQDLTDQVVWASLDTAIATIDGTGLATTKALGSATIDATLGAISGSATLNVSAPTLTSIILTPNAASAALGVTQPFVATGIFSNGDTQELASVAWGSSQPGVVSIDNTGLATTLSTGTVTITATSGSV